MKITPRCWQTKQQLFNVASSSCLFSHKTAAASPPARSCQGIKRGGNWGYHCGSCCRKKWENKSWSTFCLPPSAQQRGFHTTVKKLLKTCRLQTFHCPSLKADASPPYLDFIASEEFHFNGLLQYSLSVHVSSCLDYLNRNITFRRSGW